MSETSQRTTVQTATNAPPATGAWPEMADPMGAPNTISAATIPPSTSVASISGTAYSRLTRNLRPAGASYAMSSPVWSAAIPPEAPHSPTATPMIRAGSEPFAGLLAADWTAVLNTSDAPGGSAVPTPCTSRCTEPAPRCSRLVRPSSAIRSGNSARNQWYARLPAVNVHRSALNSLTARLSASRHPAVPSSSGVPGSPRTSSWAMSGLLVLPRPVQSGLAGPYYTGERSSVRAEGSARDLRDQSRRSRPA